ncbi:hypothetical protein PVA45_02730 [Entomospira entomophila]|uniref:Uncharacterized protein n=1 Tax=Entomospira entomophila TaxID=2719988 RepID=A0A968GDH5_9SPIO|nr:hypothetical protein [Entomospira entomophilus]NIZ40429.1 hypothetical protein [Entomospira entomophilus]WDI35987.1 hypothetical protein PVA45_02730 [Entomospira entomophilus]
MILQEELSQIIQAEQMSSQSITDKTVIIRKEREALQDQLYQEFKSRKKEIEERTQKQIELIQYQFNMKQEEQLAIEKNRLQADYEHLLTKQEVVIQKLLAYLWR